MEELGFSGPAVDTPVLVLLGCGPCGGRGPVPFLVNSLKSHLWICGVAMEFVVDDRLETSKLHPFKLC